MQYKRHYKIESKKIIARFILAVVTLHLFCSNLSVYASNGANYLPPGTSPNQGAPPPPGDGLSSAPVTPGDSTVTNVPSGRITSQPIYGTNLIHQNKQVRSRINLYMNDKNGVNKIVLTFQPDELTSQQYGQVMSLFGGGIASAPYQNIQTSQAQLIQMQKILAPYPNDPGTSAVTGKKGQTRSWISKDIPAVGYPKYGSSPVRVSRPIVKQFCRYLVLTGVVCACLFMAFASMGMIFGNRNAGSQIVAAAGGLMLLLMAYSIWKVVRFNDNNARPIGADVEAMDLSTPPGPQPSRGYAGDTMKSKPAPQMVDIGQSNLPVAPGISGSNGRAGLPLLPLGSEH